MGHSVIRASEFTLTENGNGYNGGAYSNSSGGGGGGYNSGGYTGNLPGAAGGSGIVIIRNKR